MTDITQAQVDAQMDESRQQLIEEIQGEFTQAQEELQSATVFDINPQLDEYVFANVFLPFFANDPEPVYQATLAHWISKVAGSPFQKVDIVKEGKILFTVPPAIDREALMPIKTPSGVSSIHNLVLVAHNMANVSPQQSDNYLRQQLTARAKMMHESGHAVEHAKAWNIIFAHYGRPLIGEEIPGLVLTTGAKKEEIHYDGFDEI